MHFKTWLPPGALDGGAVERLLAETTQQWAEHWFPRRLMRNLGQSVWLDAAELGTMRDLQLRFTEGGCALCLEGDAGILIARTMLDEAADGEPCTPDDENLVNRLATASIDDLCGRLAAAFTLDRAIWRRGTTDALPFAEALAIRVGHSEGAPAIRVLLSRDLVGRIVKSAAAPARKRAPLRPLAEALAGQEIGVSALVGRSGLSLGELAGLGPGDVLVLDSAEGATLPLAINGILCSGACKVEQEKGQMRLRIVNPPTGAARD